MTNEINLYSKEQTDALLAEKEDTGTAYTKAETDALLDEKEDVGTAYTKAQTDALLDEKEDVGLSYTKAQVDGLLADKATYGEVVELGGSSDIGSDLRPIKIVGDTAVAVTNPLIDTETEQTINAKKTFAVNAKSAAPASGAVDTSVVNANWASQTGAGKPNNMLHDRGDEDFRGMKRGVVDDGYIRLVSNGERGGPLQFQANNIDRSQIIHDTTTTDRSRGIMWLDKNGNELVSLYIQYRNGVPYMYCRSFDASGLIIVDKQLFALR